MKANELRIGNYIDYESGNYELISIEFDAINHITGEGYILRLSDGEFVNINNVKPIPLDKEWLKKFGFKKTTTDSDDRWMKMDRTG